MHLKIGRLGHSGGMPQRVIFEIWAVLAKDPSAAFPMNPFSTIISRTRRQKALVYDTRGKNAIEGVDTDQLCCWIEVGLVRMMCMKPLGASYQIILLPGGSLRLHKIYGSSGDLPIGVNR